MNQHILVDPDLISGIDGVQLLLSETHSVQLEHAKLVVEPHRVRLEDGHQALILAGIDKVVIQDKINECGNETFWVLVSHPDYDYPERWKIPVELVP